ncbi:AfsR/SARP family transcriptional regulator [Streptomyces sp. NRRL S-1521]|uniref:AfsR/SARP family transcriptional regulator n=1 Tax=Streptomyces sp. NRRL S-1521 TaxID=1609100 RepID=UPI0007495342|nr:BTAD domain-containing putative transcriptional regulator [Streptomyces sp. NRRL S-1521]KUL49112.1 AfsR family transcriptional regulator [Streptomyces sp. NRRL S-1521]
MRYGILGATEAYDEQGVPLSVGGRRLRALLAALALHAGRAVPVGSLIDEVWADDPPADAPAALQALVGRLRRAIGRDAIASGPGGYRLAVAPDEVDLHRFERLAREGRAALDRADPDAAARTLRDALALWRGPALADLPDRGAAARPDALRGEAVRARIEADLLLGRASDVVPELRQLTADRPYDEPLHALLIRALRAAGRGADALAAYADTRRALAEGLGTDPGPELRSLHERLLREGAGADGAGQPTGPAGSAGSAEAAGSGEAAGPTRPAGPAGAATAAEATASAGAAASAESSSRHPADPVRSDPVRPDLARSDRLARPERKGNIRNRLTSFVGREPELGAIRSDIHRARLVTLTGPGGSGKTRLAEEAAAGHPQAWLVELAPLDRPEAVPGAVVSALGLRETVLMTSELTAPQDDPLALLVEYCASRALLLILDNCEHVIDAAAELAETLLTHCPDLTVLATSREPLGVPGESVRPVEPLPPDPAHRLFAERATSVRPGFDAEESAGAVAEICRRLDGLPLAIELAAARLRLLTPRQIADRLDDRFRLLTSGARTVLPRQQTLRAVVDWSWGLLDDAERTVLREVSVFAGSWDLPAAEAVCTGEATDLIGALVDKSLIVTVADGQGGGMRYRLLETIHEYASERAAETPDLLADAGRRHSAYFRALVERAEPLLRSAEQLPWIGRLETELDNIRAAIHHSIQTRDLPAAIALALNTGWFWWLRNFRREGLQWMERVLSLAPIPLSAGAAALPDEDDPLYWPWMKLRLLHLFLLAESRPADAGQQDDTRTAYVEGVRDAFRRSGPQAATFPGLIWAFTDHFTGGTLEDTRPAVDVTVENCRRYGGDWELCVILMFRVHMAIDMSGNFSGVDEDLAELATLSGRVGDRWMHAQVSSAVGEASMARSDHAVARAAYEDALRLAHEVGAYAETSFLLARLAEISYREGDRDGALKTLDEASTEAERHGVTEARAFVWLLRSLMAADDGEVARAREMCAKVRDELRYGTPPVQFRAALRGVEARLLAADAGPAAGLAELAEALREAVEGQCSEMIVASLVDWGAALVGELGDHVRAVRLLAVGTRLRGGRPRPRPDSTAAESVVSAASAALDAGRYEAATAAGSVLTTDDVYEELRAAAHRPGG